MKTVLYFLNNTRKCHSYSKPVIEDLLNKLVHYKLQTVRLVETLQRRK